jgi:bifunctional enzyme CysN/CysC/sulfate adenylyltransferase subunit 1
MNDIAEVELETNLPLFFDRYEESRPLGSFILIDPLNNATAAAGMISASVEINHESATSRTSSAFIWLPGNRNLVDHASQTLLEAHKVAVDVDDPLIPESALPAVARALRLARVTALSTRNDLHPSTVNTIKRIVGAGWIEQEEDLRQWLEDQR